MAELENQYSVLQISLVSLVDDIYPVNMIFEQTCDLKKIFLNILQYNYVKNTPFLIKLELPWKRNVV